MSGSGAATRRLQKELLDVNGGKIEGLHSVELIKDNILNWEGLIIPKLEPFNKGAFRIEMKFPEEYPFRPPTLCFRTMIYHPNVDEKGNVCLNMLTADNWKPATKLAQVLTTLIKMINEPELDHPLRPDLAETYRKDVKKFNQEAEKFTLQKALPLPKPKQANY